MTPCRAWRAAMQPALAEARADALGALPHVGCLTWGSRRITFALCCI